MDFKFSDVGEGITEGEIVNWHVSEGDRIGADEVLVEVETDKAVVEIPSPCSGVIESLEFESGELVSVGDTLVVIDEDEEWSDHDKADEDPDQSVSNTVVGVIPESDDSDDEIGDSDRGEEILATPATRKLARDLGIDLQDVKGSGADGRITEDDVRAFAESSVGDDTSTVTGGTDEYGEVEYQDLSAVRKSIARRTETSHREIPQVTHMDSVDITELYDRVESMRESNPDSNITLTAFFVKACSDVLQEHPVLNSSYDKQNSSLKIKKYYNIGVTVDTDRGLLVPVVENADELDLHQTGDAIARLANRAREREIDLDEMRGASFTVTNIGFVGGKWATPQINHPEAAILATGRAELQPAVYEGEVTARRILPMSLSFDHRILDGADAARFINDLSQRLANPESFDI